MCSVETRTQLEVIAPQLKVGVTGPKRRYLERSAIYNISVTNPGTAPARDVELAAMLPKGLKFVEANNAGQYDAATRSRLLELRGAAGGRDGHRHTDRAADRARRSQVARQRTRPARTGRRAR